jgi:stalled ribosome rescue protein Dom34
MKPYVTAWIDHREAVIVMLDGDRETTSRTESNVEKHVRFSDGMGGSEDQHERRFAEHLHKYYDAVVNRIGDAEAILILGPGEAKHELERRLRDKGLGERIAGVETTDKMTDPQIAARARQRFVK